MTNQEVFDKVATALIKQGHQCKVSDLCSYYNSGSRCAIGWLVSEEDAKYLEENFRGKGVMDLPNSIVSGDDYDLVFLVGLQDAHDTMYEGSWVEVLKNLLLDVARDYNLNTDVLDT